MTQIQKRRSNGSSVRQSTAGLSVVVICCGIAVSIYYPRVLKDSIPSMPLSASTLSMLSLSSTSLPSSSFFTSNAVQEVKNEKGTETETTAEMALAKETENINPAVAWSQKHGISGFLFEQGIRSPEQVFDHLIAEGSRRLQQQQQQHNKNNIVLEVGVHRPRDCLNAAKAGFEAHCVEPSPPSFQVVQKIVEDNKQKARREQQQQKQQQSASTTTTTTTTTTGDWTSRIQLHPVAASSSSGGTVPFVGGGSTGDHVGIHDMWTMQKKTMQEVQNILQVPVQRLDDLLYTLTPPAEATTPDNHDSNNNHSAANKTDTASFDVSTTTTAPASNNKNFASVYLVKIDTQGHEPAVVAGLSEHLQNHRVQFVMVEFWPKGMDLLQDDSDTTSTTCQPAVTMMRQLQSYGYSLYALGVVAHPRAPKLHNELIPERPFGDIEKHCQWYYSVEDAVAATTNTNTTTEERNDYYMGYWTDVLAVAPNAELDNPRTNTGRLLWDIKQQQQKHQQYQQHQLEQQQKQ